MEYLSRHHCYDVILLTWIYTFVLLIDGYAAISTEATGKNTLVHIQSIPKTKSVTHHEKDYR